MRQSFILISISVIAMFCTARAQFILDENFSYPAGNLTEVSGGNWSVHVAGTNPVQVLNGNLSYPGYASSGMGNYIFLDGGSTGRMCVRRVFGQNLPNIYVSFLFKLQDTLDLKNHTETSSDYIISLITDASLRGLVYVKKSINPGRVVFGLAKNTSIVFDTTDVSIAETMLLVIKYKTVAAGSSNDTVSLWINPPLTESEPPANIVNGSGGDFTNGAAGIYLRQYITTGNIFLDGIRVSTTWGNAPLPVQLTSFEASGKEDGILLTWKTETEVDNFGFEVERKISSVYKNEEWKKIAFLNGYGNCNSPKYYTYTDHEVFNYCSYSYRLRQVNTDGSFSYSDEISFDTNFPGKFQLYQNFPNPFNPSTTLKFSLPGHRHVSLRLYNILGELKANIFNGYLPAGDHELLMNAGELTSGIYFCVLKSGEMQRSIKIIVAK
jgi:hypothetical protein